VIWLVWPERPKKRETDSIGSEGSRGLDPGGLGLDPGILGFLCFHLNSRVLTFLLNVTFLCKITSDSMSMVVMCVLESHRFQDMSPNGHAC